jgi:hypothetical protein
VYVCFICTSSIPKGAIYYRDEPHPAAHGRQPVRHICETCVDIIQEEGSVSATVWRRHRIPPADGLQINLQFDGVVHEAIVRPTQIRIISATQPLLARLSENYDEIYHLSPNDFEEFVLDRLDAMGMEATKVGPANLKDGGVDVIFVPRSGVCNLPFIGAAQIKHHRSRTKRVGPQVIREAAASLGAHPFSVRMLITNTTFTPDAEWFAKHHAPLLRLRNEHDLRRWIRANFTDDAEWREIPETIELCPGVTVNVPRPRNHLVTPPEFRRQLTW